MVEVQASPDAAVALQESKNAVTATERDLKQAEQRFKDVTDDTHVTHVTASSATLRGSVNPKGFNVTACKFDVGSAAGSYQTSVNCAQTVGSGSGDIANAAVPEPTTSVLLMFAAAGCYLRRVRAA